MDDTRIAGFVGDINVIVKSPHYEYLDYIVQYLIAEIDFPTKLLLMNLLDTLDVGNDNFDHRCKVERLLALVIDCTLPPYSLYVALQVTISRAVRTLIIDSDSFPPQHGTLVDGVIKNYGCYEYVAIVALAVAHHIEKTEQLLNKTIILPDNFCVLMEELTPSLMGLVERDNWLLWFPSKTNRYIRITLAMIKALYLDGCQRFDENIFDQWCVRDIVNPKSTIEFLGHPAVSMMLLVIGLQLSKRI